MVADQARRYPIQTPSLRYAAKSTEYESLNSAAFIQVTTPASSKAEETWVSKAHGSTHGSERQPDHRLKSPGELASKREFIDVVFDGIKEGEQEKDGGGVEVVH